MHLSHRKLSSFDAALEALNPDNYIPHDDVEDVLHPQTSEEILIEKDNFEKLLSTNSRIIIQVICDRPADLFDSNSRKSFPAWRKIQRYLCDTLNLKRKDVLKAKQEIIIWLKESN